MCEVCEFHQVKDFESAIKFAKGYVQRRMENVLKLYNRNKYEEFFNGLPVDKFEVVFEKLSSAFVALINCEGWEITVEELLQKLKDLGFEHILFGLENHFPQPVRGSIVEEMITLKSQEERVGERLCNLLYNIDSCI